MVVFNNVTLQQLLSIVCWPLRSPLPPQECPLVVFKAYAKLPVSTCSSLLLLNNSLEASSYCMMLLNRVTGSLQLCWLHRAAHPHPGFVKCFLAHHHTKTSAGKVRILDSRTGKSSRQHTHLPLHDPREAWRCPRHVVDGLRSAMVVIDKPRPEKNENKRREKPPCCSQRGKSSGLGRMRGDPRTCTAHCLCCACTTLLCA